MSARNVGIDVGGTKILGVVCDVQTGEISASCRRSTPQKPDAFVGEIVAMVHELIDKVGPICSIGVGLPGLVDRGATLRYGPHVLAMSSLNITTYLSEGFGVPASAHNDATCAVVAEHRLGAARGYSDVALITQGTGIGGGLIINDQVVLGANGFAGEPGHMVVDSDGAACSCGIRGCWEAYASGTGIAALAKEVLAETGASRILELAEGSEEHIRGEHVSAALAEGDLAAAEVLSRFVRWTSLGVAGLISLLDPGVVVLGGGLTAWTSSLVADVERQARDFLMGSLHRPRTPVVAAAMGVQSGAIGAAIFGQQLLDIK